MTTDRSTKEQIALCLHRAQPTPGLATPPLTIMIDEEIDRDFSEEASDRRRNLFRQEARALAIALRGSLPGGTVDALIVEMLEGKISQFVIACPVDRSVGGSSAESEILKAYIEILIASYRETAATLANIGDLTTDSMTLLARTTRMAASIHRMLDEMSTRFGIPK